MGETRKVLFGETEESACLEGVGIFDGATFGEGSGVLIDEVEVGVTRDGGEVLAFVEFAEETVITTAVEF